MNAAFERLYDATETETQVQLAEALGITQPSISDAFKRGVIPYRWLLIVVEKYGTNPEWIRTGNGQKFFINTLINQQTGK